MMTTAEAFNKAYKIELQMKSKLDSMMAALYSCQDEDEKFLTACIAVEEVYKSIRRVRKRIEQRLPLQKYFQIDFRRFEEWTA
jgi:uncharacterized sporulation protein YeaH/YhbH (DUF444 family)